MINRRLNILVGFVLMTFIVMVGLTGRLKKEYKSSFSGPTHPLVYFDKETFNEGIDLAKSESKRFNYHLSGGIIPHHLLPGFIIADFFNRLAPQSPKTIIIIGPNHDEKGNYKALVSREGWQTPFGIVEPETDKIDSLLVNGLVKIDEDTVSKDHAVSGSMSFIKYYLPNTKVVPILLSKFMSLEETETLANGLKPYLDNDTVIMAAVDFSHYLPTKVANQMDETSLSLMNNFNYREIIPLTSDYMDSPQSISVLLMAMQEKGTTKSEVLYHSNSGIITKDESGQTTSYYSIAYY